MKSKLASLSLVFCGLSAYSEPLHYESIVNEMRIDTSGRVNFSVLLREEDDEILCDAQGYHFGFSMDNTVMEKWYDTLILARSANSLLNFQYQPLTDTDCELQAITLPLLYQRGETPGEEPSSGILKETGNFGNVALTGTNGLTGDSFSGSDFYGQDAPHAAFDGYIYGEKINPDADEMQGRGIWLVKKAYEDGSLVKPWLQVDFGKEVSIIGSRVFVNDKSLGLGRSPRNVTVLISDDGEEFTEFESFVLTAEEISSTAFTTTATARFFRLQISSNYGDDTFIEVDEWELYQGN